MNADAAEKSIKIDENEIEGPIGGKDIKKKNKKSKGNL